MRTTLPSWPSETSRELFGSRPSQIRTNKKLDKISDILSGRDEVFLSRKCDRRLHEVWVGHMCFFILNQIDENDRDDVDWQFMVDQQRCCAGAAPVRRYRYIWKETDRWSLRLDLIRDLMLSDPGRKFKEIIDREQNCDLQREEIWHWAPA